MNGPYFFYDGDPDDLTPDERQLLREMNAPRSGPSLAEMIAEYEGELGIVRPYEKDDTAT